MERRIRCTAENVHEVRDLVKADAELSALVASLQAQGVFPGLRGVSFVFTGRDGDAGKGLGAWPVKNAPQAVSGDLEGKTC